MFFLSDTWLHSVIQMIFIKSCHDSNTSFWFLETWHSSRVSYKCEALVWSQVSCKCQCLIHMTLRWDLIWHVLVSWLKPSFVKVLLTTICPFQAKLLVMDHIDYEGHFLSLSILFQNICIILDERMESFKVLSEKGLEKRIR